MARATRSNSPSTDRPKHKLGRLSRGRIYKILPQFLCKMPSGTFALILRANVPDFQNYISSDIFHGAFPLLLFSCPIPNLTFQKFFDIIIIESEKTLSHLNSCQYNLFHLEILYPPPSECHSARHFEGFSFLFCRSKQAFSVKNLNISCFPRVFYHFFRFFFKNSVKNTIFAQK